jgi:hypothetical protein
VNDVLSLVADVISKYRSIREEFILHPPRSVPLHDESKLLPRMPDHTDGPYTDFDGNNLLGFEEQFTAVKVIGL